MNCQQARPLIDFYADGELDAVRIQELEKHFHDCPACMQAWRNAQGLKQALKQEALYFAAPAELRRSLKAQLHSPSETQPRWNVLSWWTGVGAGFATACLLLLVTLSLMRSSDGNRLAQEVVSGHVRALMADHALDVVSTDQHTVKPWFNGKLDFSPPVKDLAAQQFPLVGGRLDYIDGHSAAALVFHRNKHVINLFIWPAKEKDSIPVTSPPMQGHNLVHWSKSGMAFWAVSDLNEKELTEFADAFGAD